MDSSILGRRNEWWNTGKSSLDSMYKTARDELQSIIDGLEERRIQIIIGPRRVGKSTLMHQTIAYLLKTGVEAKRILFFSCDDPTVFSSNTTIGDIIETYLNEVLYETALELHSRVYIFIDEIHAYKDWQLWLKNYYEPQYNIKFVVSGSSASHLFKSANESLLGRTDTIRIMPLSFIQFCRFWSVYKDFEKIAQFIEIIPRGSIYENPQEYYAELEKEAWLWNAFKPYVNAALGEYLVIGGYPEYFEQSSTALWQTRLAQDIITQGLYRDIVSIYNIKAPEKLEKLLFFIADNNGQAFSMKTIADTIGCDNETVSVYLTYLAQAYMTIVLDNYSVNVGKRLRSNKTLYIMDNGIVNAILRLSELTDAQIGKIVESICAREALSICETNMWNLHYWRENAAEVDLVIDKKTQVLPIEIKYRSKELSTSLGKFHEAFPKANVPVSLVITKDTMKSVDTTLYIPFWLAR